MIDIPYIDKQYYDDDYQGKPIEDVAEFERTAKRASDNIDELTSYSIKNNLPDVQMDLVKKATAAMIEHYALNGGYEASNQPGMGNVSIGSFSYNAGDSASGEVPSNVVGYLKYSGLLYKGIGTYG
ncbi:hypothetical protein J2Z83_003735 [Virgibacillus natechei]|uniref:DUF4054 domain-containing protein n=1 Tax=Virgibacillus natechei TaxID=1216297 RepID=A0ABS4IKU5_9BACI|nr:hypothetical protein [Virgibacillus natechei]MBP1971584.1 hypothetical protein [Virgibacillus natechei]UZD13083.1 hypothetical protein OLD84_00445 [Virgibacillus natechei]